MDRVSPGASAADRHSGRIISVAAISPADVWALAGGNRRGEQADVMEHWNGTQWSIVSLPISGPLHSMSAVSANDVWAVGKNGLIRHWNGTQWSQVANPDGRRAALLAWTR